MGYFHMSRPVESIFGAVVTAPHQIPYTFTAVGGETSISLPVFPVTGLVTIGGGVQAPLDNYEIEGNVLHLGGPLDPGDVVYCLFDKVLSPEGQNSTTRIYKFKSVGGETSFTPDFTSYGVQSLYIDGKYQTPIDDYTYNKETGVVNLASAIVGAGKWVVAELYVQQNYPALATPGGADMVGNMKGDSSIFSYRTVAKALKDSLWFDDFKGTTDDERWASMAAYLSTPVVTSISVMFSARMHSFTSNPQQLTKPFELHGMGVRNTVLTFTDCNGVSADLSSYGSRYIQSKISNMALVANSSNANTGVYFKGVQSYSPHDAALVLSNVSLYGFRDISSGGAEANEWETAISLDDADEIHMHDVYITGSNLNALYATRTTSKSIVANKVTGLRVSQSSIYLTGTGIEVTGQSEGMILRGLTIVAVDIGVSFHDMVNPANNHVISDSHISAFTKGIEFRKHADRINNPTAVYLSNLFILEREGNASKPLYTAIELYAIRSILSGITIQSNTNTSPNRKAIVVSNQNNSISDIIGLNAGTGITIDAVDTLNVMYNNIRFVGDLQSDLSGSVQYAVGAGLTNSGDPNSYNVRGDTFRTYDLQGREQYASNGGRHMFGGGRHNVNVYHDFRTVAGGSAAYDGRIFFTGGSASLEGQAQATIFASSIAFAGHLASATANAYTCGTAGRPWGGGFTQTAFTITSDERAKTKPIVITDKMLDAWSEVEWCQYKLLDRVESKGEEARWHHGVVAQRAVEAFERHGLDSHDYGFMCYDEWEASDEVLVHHEETPDTYDVEGNLLEEGKPAYSEVVTPAREAGSRYSIRYEEALALEAALQRRNYKEQKLINEELFRRIEALEAK